LPASFDDTIVALASAQGRAGVAVVRLSGPAAQSLLTTVCPLHDVPEPRKATLRDIVDPRNGETMDHALVLFFAGPHSFTGEDVVELHLHGGPSLVRAVLEMLCSWEGVRLAQAGEFSRRAYENSKLDLTEAEGIADLVDAETAAQRRQALRQMDGALGRLYNGWADQAIHTLAYLEAGIDFADEEVPEEITQGQQESINALAQAIRQHLDDGHRGERLREGFMVALLGPPNAGKSSLLNALVQREAAIVSPIPGTTRDIVEVNLDLGGYPVSLADTAGLRETADVIESEGVRRALARAEQADLKILVLDGSASVAHNEEALKNLVDDRALCLVNKKDCLAEGWSLPSFVEEESALYVCAKDGEGLDVLVARLISEIEKRFAPTASPALTRLRHRLALEACLGHLDRAAQATAPELCAEDMRLALRSLGQITGTVDVEDILDVIFSSFCIGK